jgi:plastocyanin
MGSSTFFTAASTGANPTITVGVNTAVTWTNDSGVQHDVIFSDPTAPQAVGNGNSGNIGLHTSGTSQRQFAAAGTYPFHCTQHPPGMIGTVVVQ